MNTTLRLLALLPAGLLPTVAAAQNVPTPLEHPELDPLTMLATIIYGVLGLGLAILGYKVFERVVPFDLNKEIEHDQNPAVGLVLGAMIIGMSIIVAASIH